MTPRMPPAQLDLRLQRQPTTDGCTLGQLFLDGRHVCWTLEDAVHGGPKVPGQTAIPAGRYRVDLTFSRRFQRVLPLLRDVPGFDGVRIHSGNTADDTAGCILVGQTAGADTLTGSRLALVTVLGICDRAAGRGETAWITIVAAAEVPLFA